MEQPKSPSGGESRRRRAYEPPAIEETASFETLALACGKTVGDGSCPYNGGTQNS